MAFVYDCSECSSCRNPHLGAPCSNKVFNMFCSGARLNLTNVLKIADDMGGSESNNCLLNCLCEAFSRCGIEVPLPETLKSNWVKLGAGRNVLDMLTYSDIRPLLRELIPELPNVFILNVAPYDTLGEYNMQIEDEGQDIVCYAKEVSVEIHKGKGKNIFLINNLQHFNILNIKSIGDLRKYFGSNNAFLSEAAFSFEN